ncbi:MAG: 50S ribosomal protein L20 [Alphaproteobacteria bacterium]|nr:50S ribosomal protein L20 [Alphaproteobacteria bacterium]
MARIKNASLRKVRRRKLMKRTSGFFQARGKTFRQANEAAMKADANAFRGRKERKRQFRRLWIVRINAGLNPHGLSYSRFMHGLKLAGVSLDRKALAELAVHEPAAFGAVVEKAQQALG